MGERGIGGGEGEKKTEEMVGEGGKTGKREREKGVGDKRKWEDNQ